jgi:hypothetical protein
LELLLLHLFILVQDTAFPDFKTQDMEDSLMLLDPLVAFLVLLPLILVLLDMILQSLGLQGR